MSATTGAGFRDHFRVPRTMRDSVHYNSMSYVAGARWVWGILPPIVQ